ncbi:MAG: hypothetical protein P8130_08125 [Deltaproteobacteria bacterium]
MALIAAPWHLHGRPSIQLGCLKAYLEKSDSRIQVKNLHPYLHVAAKLGAPRYHKIASNMWLSEALFAPLLFPEKKESAERLAEKEARREEISSFAPHTVTRLLDQICNAWTEAIDWSSFELIGFSVCFHQLLASLSLARKIKARAPASCLVFGGSSILAGMEDSLRQLAGIDFCINGEGEVPLLDICQQILAGKIVTESSGLQPENSFSKPDAAVAPCCDHLQLADLDVLPVPDYADYLTEATAAFGQSSLAVTLPVEFSRGCWWNKCAFCNLNLQWQGYRRKSALRMQEEILTLSNRHQILDFSFTDNTLPLRESREFFPRIAKTQVDIKFFAELRQEQAASFDFAMKNAVQYGIRLQGNIILRFPGSSEQERDETLQNLDYVFSYAPLQHATFFLGHSSPVYCNPAAYGIRAVTVHPKFASLLPDRVRRKLPLLVCGYRGDQLYQKRLWQPVQEKIDRWRQYHRQRGCTAAERPLLEYRDGGNFLLIRQEVPDGRTLHHRLTGISRALYLFCSAPVTIEKICRRFTSLPKRDLTVFLDELQRKRLVFKEVDRYLALAVRQRRD